MRTLKRKGLVLPWAEQLKAARVLHASIFVLAYVSMPTKHRAALAVGVSALSSSHAQGSERGICRPCAGQREARGPQGVSICGGIPHPLHIFIGVCDRIVLLLMTPPPTALLWPAATRFIYASDTDPCWTKWRSNRCAGNQCCWAYSLKVIQQLITDCSFRKKWSNYFFC